MNKLLLIVAILTLTSCLTSEVSQKNIPEDAKPIVVSSKMRNKAIEAAKSAEEITDSRSIIGSSSIGKDNKNKTYFLYGAEHLKLDNYYFDIPVVYNDSVKKWLKYFLNRGRGFFERYSARAGRYAPVLGQILEEYGLPRDLIFLAMAESGFQNKAKSWARAVGPWQFMPYTGKRFGLNIDWYIDERRDPIKATIAASRYLKLLYEEFGSWELAAAAYNAGEGKVGRAIKRYKTENFWKISRGRYLKSETKNYVPKIMALAIIGKNLKSFGFEDIDFHEPLDFEEVIIPGQIDLIKLSEKMGVEFEEIQRLNPEILRWFTPANLTSYHLRVPVGARQAFVDCCAKVEEYVAKDFMTYKVQSNRSRMTDVSRKFRIKDKKVLTWLNDLPHNARLKKGQLVILPFKSGQNVKDNMYADLYEKPRKSVRLRRTYKKRLRLALRRGKKISSPNEFYTVKRGDSLWTVSRRTGTNLDTLIASNYNLLRKRRIRAGDRLAVR